MKFQNIFTNKKEKRWKDKRPTLKLIRKIKKIKKDVYTIYNIGSNIGRETILLSQSFPSSQIYDFEPVSKLLEIAKSNIKKYNLKNIEFFNYAIGEKEIKEHVFYNNELSTLLPSHHHKMHSKKQAIKIEKLDKLVIKLKLHHPSFLRISVNGYGTEAILGSKLLITKYKPVIWYKWNTALSHLSEEYMLNSINLLKSMDYVPYYSSFSRTDFIFVHKNANVKEKKLHFKKILWANRRREVVMKIFQRRFKFIFFLCKPFIRYYFYLKGKYD